MLAWILYWILLIVLIVAAICTLICYCVFIVKKGKNKGKSKLEISQDLDFVVEMGVFDSDILARIVPVDGRTHLILNKDFVGNDVVLMRPSAVSDDETIEDILVPDTVIASSPYGETVCDPESTSGEIEDIDVHDESEELFGSDECDRS